MNAVGWVIAVVIFWTLIFFFAFWFSRRALGVPTDAELEYEEEQAEHAAHAGHDASEAGGVSATH
ncbi:MAG TPA: hypothetical protein VKQ36_08690 [Ktedonobacterales bacterium]|nr:hypothetical protein [Ktedonobacterales bacterium]